MQKLGSASLSAIAFGILFAFLPYHLSKGIGHILLSAIYVIPTAIWLIFQIWEPWCVDLTKQTRFRGLWKMPDFRLALFAILLIETHSI